MPNNALHPTVRAPLRCGNYPGRLLVALSQTPHSDRLFFCLEQRAQGKNGAVQSDLIFGVPFLLVF
ncbi:hypothetical protein ABW22_09385 [Thiobacillus denitrificans]|uniref:Uncharacterized protein n=1 Tax=Thiobacillus denitrificans TaxID=36861 RepID=A0A106BNS1_THIDE|nr:hypothetical protein ABW22_09385 [Thiobacillus denitrificans]